VRLVNPKALLPASRVIRPRRYAAFSARLSPDGKHLLFPSLRENKDYTYRLVLLDIAANRETEIPIDLPEGYETVCTRFNFFNPKGDKLALFATKQYPNPTVMEIVIYDIPSKTIRRSPISGNATMAQFAYTGKGLLVSQHNSFVARASVTDFSMGKPLASGWIHSCNSYLPFAAVFQQPNPRRPNAAFALLNLESGESTPLPMHEENSGLDDVTSHWSLDGRYLFYLDVAGDGNDQLRPVIRVWNSKENREKALVHGVMCLGPGPTADLMLMTSTEETDRGSVRVYSIASGSLSSLETQAIRAIHAYRNRIAYAATLDGTERIYVAELVLRKD